MRHQFHKDGQWVGFISRGAAVAAVVSTAGLLQSLPAAYGQVVWDGGGNGTSMSDGSNWVGDAVPTSGQDAVIDNSNVTVPSTIEIGDSLFGENYGTLTINTGNTNLNIKALLTSSGFTSSTLFLDGNFTSTSDLIKIGSSVTSATITISDGAAPPTSTGQAIIELADDGKINVMNSGATLTIKSLIQGSGFIFEKTGAGTLNLGGVGVAGNSNTFGGAGKVLKVSGGTLGVAVDGSMGNASNTVELSSGAKIKAIANAPGPFGGESIGGFTTTRALALTSGGGTIDDSGSTITWAGQATGTGGLTKTGAGTLILSGSSIHTYTGATNINQGTLSLSGYASGTSPSQTFNAGGRALNTDFNVTNGGTLLLDSSDKVINVGGFPPSGTTVNNRNDDRIGGTYDGVSSGVQNGKAVNLSNGTFTVMGSSFGAIQEFFGSLNVQAGANTVNVLPHGTLTGGGPFGPPAAFTPTVALYLTADSISRSSLGTVLINGDNLGAGSVSPDPGITLFNAPTMTGGGGGSGTLTMSILPYAVGNSSPRSATQNYGLMSYQVDFNGTNFTSLGLRNLRSNEYDTLAGANGSSNHNVRVTGAETLASGGQTVNGLVIATGSVADSGFNDTLTVTTGAILGTNNGGSSTAGSINVGTLAFGGSEAFISTYGSNLTISSKITGSGLTIIKNGPTNTLSQGILFLSSTTSDYTGQTLIYGGGIQVTANNALGTTAGNTVVYSGSSLLFNGVTYTTAEPVTINGTGFGTTSIFGSTQYAAIHDVTASSTFSGPITLGTNSNIAANGGLTLTLDGGIGEASSGLLLIIGTSNNGSGTVVLGGASTYTGGTRLDIGTLAIGHNSALGSGDLFFNGGGVRAEGTARTVSNGVTFLTNGSVEGSLDLTFNGTVSLGANVRTLTVTNTGVTTIGGSLSGTAASGLTKAGTEALVISSSNTGYTGTTTLSNGTLQLDATAASGNGTLNMTTGILVLNASNASGTGTFNLNGGAIVPINAARTIANTTTNVGGNFTVSGSEDLTFSSTTFALGASASRFLTIDNPTTTISGTVTGTSSSITKTGTGALVMAGSGGTYNGGTTLSSGSLGFGASSTDNGFGTVINGPIGLLNLVIGSGTSVFATGGAQTIHNEFDPTGNFTFTGTDVLTLRRLYTGNVASITVTVDSGTNTIVNTPSSSGIDVYEFVGGPTWYTPRDFTKAGAGSIHTASFNISGTLTVNAGSLFIDGTGMFDSGLRNPKTGIFGFQNEPLLMTVNGGLLEIDSFWQFANSRLTLTGGKVTMGSTATNRNLFRLTASGGEIQVDGAPLNNVEQFNTVASGTFTKSGAGIYSVTGSAFPASNVAVNLGNNSSVTVSAGTLKFNLGASDTTTVGTGVSITVNPGASLELANTTAALGTLAGNRVNVTNNSTTSVNVTGTNQVVGAITGVGNTNVSNDSDLTAKQIVQNNLTINGTAGNPNAKVTLDNDGTTPNPNGVLNTLTSLTMANDGGASVYGGPFRTFYSELDLKDNNLAIRAPAGTGQTVWTSDILPGVLTGFNNGAFGNKGLTSSTAPGAGNTALAAIINDDGFGNVLFGSGADIGAGSGQTEFDSLGALTIDDILIKYTYYGDLDLSGQVDGLDQALMDIFFGSVAGGWLFGDIDYNGFTDGLDQALLDIFFGNGTGGGFGDPLGGSDSGPTTIPEPASLTLLALGGLGLVRRPRRR